MSIIEHSLNMMNYEINIKNGDFIDVQRLSKYFQSQFVEVEEVEFLEDEFGEIQHLFDIVTSVK